MKDFSESSFTLSGIAFIFISYNKKKIARNLFSVSVCFIGLVTAGKMVCVFFFSSITCRLRSSKLGMTKSNNDLSHFASKL